MSTVGIAVLLVFVLFGIFGPLLAPYSATEIIAADARQPPSWRHFFGTDHLGRDVFSRVVHGTRSILGLTGSGAAMAVLIGTSVGLFAGYRGGWADEIIMRLLDSLLSIPALLLALVLLGTIGPSASGVLIVISIVYTPIVARVVRSETLVLRQRGFVETARLQGEPLWRILVGEILPSVLPALSVEAALRFSYAIFLVASLGFLGVGVQPPTPDWGLMVKEARIFIGLTPWALFFPAGAISLLVISVNLTADGLKRVLQGEESTIGRRARRLVIKTRSTATVQCGAPDVDGSGLLPLARFRELTVSYFQNGQWRDALRNVSFDVSAGETYGLVGESGSGKSTLALAIVGYLAENGAVRDGSVCVGGRFVKLHAPTQRSRDRSIAFVAQDALASLNPSIRIGAQIGEIIRRRGHTAHPTRDEVGAMLRHVELRDAERIARRYPHELSGGMLQRVALAMALAMEPDLLILDEPTTGLDVTTQAAILVLLREILVRRQHATLHISHDLDVIFTVSDRIGVLYAGEMVEEASAAALLAGSYHPYASGLLSSAPRLAAHREQRRSVLGAMPGKVPRLGDVPVGCIFAARCPLAITRCRVERPPQQVCGSGSERRIVRCHRWEQVRDDPGLLHGFWREETPSDRGNSVPIEEGVLNVDRLETVFPVGPRRGATGRAIHAVDGVSLGVSRRETLGIVGESGSGKTTLARTILGLERSSAGRIFLLGERLPPSLSRRPLRILSSLQAVAQHPDESLNPYRRVGRALERPLRRLAGVQRRDGRQRVTELLEDVGLSAEFATRWPRQLSGGEKQRVAIARMLAAQPRVVLLDEPTSALDVSVQARLLNLLLRLQQRHERAMLFISHDLAVISYLADRIAVLYRGRVMEEGRTQDVLLPPYHPYTELLLLSIPGALSANEPPNDGRMPESRFDRILGCPFSDRCSHRRDICHVKVPPWLTCSSTHRIYCHLEIESLPGESVLGGGG